MGLDEAVVVALGSNLSGRWRSPIDVLERTLSCFSRFGLTVAGRSCWWRSAAWPDPSEPEYINGVALVETRLAAGGVLAALHALERRFGRERTAANAPRVLDLDLIAFGREVVPAAAAASGLVLPHPRAAERRFVMGPLAEIAPDWRHPQTGLTARALAESAHVGRDARPVGGDGRAPS